MEILVREPQSIPNRATALGPFESLEALQNHEYKDSD